jgi:hypothetical protein
MSFFKNHERMISLCHGRLFILVFKILYGPSNYFNFALHGTFLEGPGHGRIGLPHFRES